MSGGGFSEVQRALSAWNADPGSSLSLQYGGTTSRTGGFSSSDGANVVLFEDPNDEIPGSFDCNSGGVLAIGGFSKVSGTADFGGATYWRIVEGEVVTQDGAGCFFAGNNGKNGELVFAHEIGHALGLGHSCGDSGTPSCADPVLNDALMRAFAHNDGRGARLGADDRAALAVLYGDGAPPCTVPTAPSGLSATAISSSRIDLTWQDRSQDEEGFAVERKPSGATSFTRVVTLPAGARSYSDTGLAASTGYTYQVRATGCGGDSSAAGPASAQTPAVPSDPPSDPPTDPSPGPTDPPPDPPSDPPSDPPAAGAPYGLQADVLSQTEVRLDWSWDGAAPSDFRVELRSGVLFVEVATVPGSTTHVTLSGLRPKTGYSFRVRARTSSGYGPYSEVVSARTDPQAAGDPGALSAAEVACDGARLRGLLERLAVEAPNLQTGRDTGINLSFTATGDFAGIAFTLPSGGRRARGRARAGVFDQPGRDDAAAQPVPASALERQPDPQRPELGPGRRRGQRPAAGDHRPDPDPGGEHGEQPAGDRQPERGASTVDLGQARPGAGLSCSTPATASSARTTSTSSGCCRRSCGSSRTRRPTSRWRSTAARPRAATGSTPTATTARVARSAACRPS